MKANTTDYFIERAIAIYGDKYDYSKTKYTNTEVPLLIVCPVHGEFIRRPLKFLKGRECTECKVKSTRTTYRLTTDEFIKKAKLKHGNKYDYSKVNYVNQKTKVILICNKHGEFNVVPNYHLDDGIGCKECGKESIKEKTSYSREEFFNMCKEKHGEKYDYSLVNYINYYSEVNIICPEHGVISQTPFNHLRTVGCNKCARKITGLNIRLTQEEFISRSNVKHSFKYDYSLVNFTKTFDKVKIICKKHGDFLQTPACHMQGAGCPTCKSSKGEREVYSFLQSKLINFITQKKFNNCKNIRPLPFDFYLPDYNLCIEYQGAQHFSAYHNMGGEKSFEKLIKNDKIKRKFCFDNNIKLLEIKYTDSVIDVLENVLSNNRSIINNQFLDCSSI